MPAKLFVRRPADFREFPKEAVFEPIHERIEEQAQRYPRQVALRTPETTHTYAELNAVANTAAVEILSAAGTPLAQAAILQSNKSAVLINMLASMKAHKAYVPLDPAFPKARLEIMLEDAESALLLTDDEHLELAEELAAPRRIRILNTSRIKPCADAPNPGVACDPLDRAYILYTSGSTGRPKGIAFLHRNLLHSTMCFTNALFFSPSDRVTWLHSPSFSSSVVDIYCALTNGATAYPWDAKKRGFTGLADWLVEQKVTTFQWIPSAFRQFLRTVPNDFLFRDIRFVLMASEPLTVREVELFRGRFAAGSHLVNQVGTSESYNYRLYPVNHELPLEGVTVPGGYAVSEDREVLILNHERRPLAAGETGEIGVRSDYLSGGYWRDEALNRSKFIQLPDAQTPVYLTGDLGRLTEDGCLIHLGRKDSQVKIRGYRVELAEVEYVLASAPGVEDSTAAVVKNRLGEDQLVAYVVLQFAQEFRQQAVETHLRSRLPDYMVPRHYVVLDALPSLPAGKIDRNALPNPFDKAESSGMRLSAAPGSVEEEIRNLFAELLQVENADRNLDFLQAGADSLTAAILMERIYRRFDVEIGIDEFLESPTPGRLAKLICDPRTKRAERGKEAPPQLQLRPHCQTPPELETSAVQKNLVIISAGNLGREAYTWTAQAISAGANLRIKGFLDNRTNALDGYSYDAPILGDASSYPIDEDDVFVSAIGTPRDKRRYSLAVAERGGHFTSVVHPLANVGSNIRIGTGVLIAPFCSLTCDVTVGNHVSIGAFTNLGHDAVIGNWCQICGHVGINGHVVLEEGVFLGSHVCILPGVRIGAWAYIGAGSVVVKDVEPGAKMFGNPAVPIGRQKVA